MKACPECGGENGKHRHECNGAREQRQWDALFLEAMRRKIPGFEWGPRQFQPPAQRELVPIRRKR